MRASMRRRPMTPSWASTNGAWSRARGPTSAARTIMADRAYHFAGETLRNGEPIPLDGEWLYARARDLKMCEYGLHFSEHPLDALNYAPGFTCCLIEYGGKVLRQHDKGCASERLIVARVDVKALCLKFARDCASDVLHLWDAPQVVKDFLATGDNAYAAAYAANAAGGGASAAYAASGGASAAYAAYAASAAYYATRYAAYASAYAAYAAAYAATSATREKYRGWFKERIEAEFAKLSPLV